MKKTLFIMTLMLATLAGCGGSGGDDNNGSDETIVIGEDKTLSVTTPLKVVCYGNSITKHGYLPSVGWYGNWGMAASVEANDYCHLLQSKLQKYNSSSTVVPYNVGNFENDSDPDLSALFDSRVDDCDVIVIRFGENAQDADLFKQNLEALIEKAKTYTSKIVITGDFWTVGANEDGSIDTIIRSEANSNDLWYVSLSSIRSRTDVYPKKGDTLYDIDGNAYTIDSDFILTHPNDKGMSLIATAVFNGIASLYE